MATPFDLQGRVALVTGAAAGMGAAISAALAAAGADVACHGNARPTDHTRETVEQLGRRACQLQGDLADSEVPRQLIDATLDAFGQLDILVNNAGLNLRSPAVTFDDADWNRVIEVNLGSVFRLCKRAGAHMIAQGSGKIINIASLLSFQGGVTVPAYAAAKGGVAQLTKALANEWAPLGVNVNAIAPGYIRTDLTQALQQDGARNRAIVDRIPAGRWGDPADVAGAVVFLASSASAYVHGHVLVVDGGWMSR
ncbi:MAG: glucose 1-dehydrogenase [Acidobacteria bacterium]|nr:glucose 1-dehydrogenase [Acidobacteriota bacterium]